MTVDPVNDAPKAVDDTIAEATTAGEPFTFPASDLTSNDTDVDSQSLTVTEVSKTQNGTVNLSNDGRATFTGNGAGPASFEYTVSDGAGGTDTASVNLTVKTALPANNAPKASGDTARIAEDTAATIDVLANDTDPDGDRLSVVAFQQPAQGRVILNASGTLNERYAQVYAEG